MRSRASRINVSQSSILPVILFDIASSLLARADAVSSSLADVIPNRRSYSVISSSHLPSSANTAYDWASDPLVKSTSTAIVGSPKPTNIKNKIVNNMFFIISIFILITRILDYRITRKPPIFGRQISDFCYNIRTMQGGKS